MLKRAKRVMCIKVNSESSLRSCTPLRFVNGIRKLELNNFLQENKGYIPFTPYEKISLIDSIELLGNKLFLYRPNEFFSLDAHVELD